MSDGPPRIFDRAAYGAHRRRAARAGAPSFLAEAAAMRLAERIEAVNRRFARGLELGARPESIGSLAPLAESWVRAGPCGPVLADEEALPFAPQSFDLIVSVLALHAVNDLPGALIQIARALKPDGLFMAALFGGDTLTELRQAFAQADAEVLNGASPHVAPFADVREMGTLLQRAGFALPVTDVERLPVRYGSLATLFQDLRAAGETNALAGRRTRALPRTVLGAAAQSYAAQFADPDGRLRATFDLVFLTGWAPHESQQKPLRPGSAQTRLADALGTTEQPTGEAPER